MEKTRNRIVVQKKQGNHWRFHFILGIVFGLTVGSVRSHAATLVSNLSESVFGSQTVFSAQWIATAFTTGSNAGGYSLESIAAKFALATGTPSNFSMLLAQEDSGNPGATIETLTGSQPTTGGNKTFTSTGTNLDADTKYWVILSSTDSAPDTFHARTTTVDNQTSSDGWVIGNTGRKSTDSGVSWSNLSGGLTGFLRVNATPVPEPHEYALLMGLSLVSLAIVRLSNSRNDSKSHGS